MEINLAPLEQRKFCLRTTPWLVTVSLFVLVIVVIVTGIEHRTLLQLQQHQQLQERQLEELAQERQWMLMSRQLEQDVQDLRGKLAPTMADHWVHEALLAYVFDKVPPNQIVLSKIQIKDGKVVIQGCGLGPDYRIVTTFVRNLKMKPEFDAVQIDDVQTDEINKNPVVRFNLSFTDSTGQEQHP